MVSPPPGVFSGLEGAAHGLGQAAGQGEAEPDAGRVVAVAEALEGQEDPLPVGVRHAGPAVDDPELDPAAVGAGGDERRPVGGAVAQRVGRSG